MKSGKGKQDVHLYFKMFGFGSGVGVLGESHIAVDHQC